MSTKIGARARRPPLSRERVLHAALRLVDSVGIEALSMRRLGDELGVEAMSLYRHVASKDDVLDGIIDRVASEIALPPIGGDWKRAMQSRASSAHEVLLRHPWATLLFLSRASVGPAMLRCEDATLGCLLHAGFSYEEADHACHAIDNHVHGFTLQKLGLPFEAVQRAAAARTFLARIPEEQYPYLHGLSQQVIEGKHTGLHDFHFGLDLILDGLERILDKNR